ncbi:MAG TPA: amidohydrolase [Bacilli bacterium]
MTVNTIMQDLLQAGKRMENELIDFRRNLHSFPELSTEESETAAKVAEKLRKLGLDVKTNIGGHGIMADLQGNHPGRCIALRADMDALPILEESNLPFASKRPGVMHACGHDAHTTILLGAVKLLVQQREQLAGRIRFIFQPAEEINTGAKAMISQGVLEGVDEIYGLHNLPTLSAGQAALINRQMMASVDRLEITLEGKGGHGAMPDQSIDPIVAASAIVMGLQTAVSREISPFDPVVVTIGSIQAGEAYNVVPQRAKLTGTIRTFSLEVQRHMEQRLRRIIGSIAEAYRCKATLDYFELTPVLKSTTEHVNYVESIVDQLMGTENRLLAAPTMGGEDFSVYLEHLPGCFFWLGSGPEKDAGQAYGLHHPKYTLNEECLALGASLLAAIAIRRGGFVG